MNMTADNENKVVFIDPIYIEYRKMWKENRWRFSGELVRLTIKQNQGLLDNIEQHRLSTMDRVIDENNGNWTEGYEYDDGILSKLKSKRRR
jgi:hypothetical protein